MWNLIIIISAVAATVLTYYISLNLKRGTVFASGLVTLVAGILFQSGLYEIGVVAACGSYAAMVSKEKFPNISDMIYVGILCGIIFLLTQSVFVGVGGRLGSIAAISGFAWLGIKNIKKRAIG